RRGGGRRRRVVIDDDDITRAGLVEIDEAGSKDADHHGLDDRQRKRRSHRGVDGVPPHGEHLQAGRGSQGMIRGYHPTRRHRGLFLHGKWAASLVAPGAYHRFSFARVRDKRESSLLSGYYNTPAIRRESMGMMPADQGACAFSLAKRYKDCYALSTG